MCSKDYETKRFPRKANGGHSLASIQTLLFPNHTQRITINIDVYKRPNHYTKQAVAICSKSNNSLFQ